MEGVVHVLSKYFKRWKARRRVLAYTILAILRGFNADGHSLPAVEQ
jgi:hypothetical protein